MPHQMQNGPSGARTAASPAAGGVAVVIDLILLSVTSREMIESLDSGGYGTDYGYQKQLHPDILFVS
jgi:hypothetical protein